MEKYLEISGMGHDGRGVLRAGGKTTFVFNGLMGEIVEIDIIKSHPRFDEAIVKNIVKKSVDRVTPVCTYFGKCGGCKLQHLNQASQVKLKEAVLIQQLKHFGGVTPKTILPPLMALPYGYRRKAHYSVQGSGRLGFKALYQPGYLLDIDTCKVLDPRLDALFAPLHDLIHGLKNDDNLSRIDAACGDHDIAMVFHHSSPFTLLERKILGQWAQDHKVILLLKNVNNHRLNRVFIDGGMIEEETTIKFSVGNDISLFFSPSDFTQINSEINQLMIQRAIELLGLTKADRVLDLYCGIGNFSLPMARHCHKVVGVEGAMSLVKKAQVNAQYNGINNAHFICADLNISTTLCSNSLYDYNKILIDPPRAGAKALLQALDPKGIEQIIYISCNSSTLARDAGILSNKGFMLEAIGVMDMFPQTDHIEVMASFKAQF